MSGAVFDVRERLRWMLDENTCNISPSVAEGARGALEILDCRDSEIASLKESLDELQEKYDALEDGAKNAYGLYKEYQRLEQEDLLVRLLCKAGDRVYCTYGRSYKVSGVEKGLGGIKIYGISDNFLGYYGKEVFLTQAEAKQVLKGDE